MFPFKDALSKCKQMSSYLWNNSYLRKKALNKNSTPTISSEVVETKFL